jgi:hypothetical protein
MINNIEIIFNISKVESLFPIIARIIPAEMFGVTKARSRKEWTRLINSLGTVSEI